MALPFIYSANTKAKASEMNTNLTYVDYTDIDNNKKIQWNNVAGSLDAYILENTGDQLLIYPGATSLDVTGEIRMTGGSSKVIAAYNTGSSKRVFIQHDDTNSIISGSHGSMVVRAPSGNPVYLDPGSDGQAVVLARHPRRTAAGTSTYQNAHIQSGFVAIQGDGTGGPLLASVTFPIAFASDNVRVIVSSCGHKGSAVTDEGDFDSGTANSRIVTTRDITSTGFVVGTVGMTFSVGSYYGIMWIAIGPV